MYEPNKDGNSWEKNPESSPAKPPPPPPPDSSSSTDQAQAPPGPPIQATQYFVGGIGGGGEGGATAAASVPTKCANSALSTLFFGNDDFVGATTDHGNLFLPEILRGINVSNITTTGPTTTSTVTTTTTAISAPLSSQQIFSGFVNQGFKQNNSPAATASPAASLLGPTGLPKYYLPTLKTENNLSGSAAAAATTTTITLSYTTTTTTTTIAAASNSAATGAANTNPVRLANKNFFLVPAFQDPTFLHEQCELAHAQLVGSPLESKKKQPQQQQQQQFKEPLSLAIGDEDSQNNNNNNNVTDSSVSPDIVAEILDDYIRDLKGSDSNKQGSTPSDNDSKAGELVAKKLTPGEKVLSKATTKTGGTTAAAASSSAGEVAKGRSLLKTSLTKTNKEAASAASRSGAGRSGYLRLQQVQKTNRFFYSNAGHNSGLGLAARQLLQDTTTTALTTPKPKQPSLVALAGASAKATATVTTATATTAGTTARKFNYRSYFQRERNRDLINNNNNNNNSNQSSSYNTNINMNRNNNNTYMRQHRQSYGEQSQQQQPSVAQQSGGEQDDDILFIDSDELTPPKTLATPEEEDIKQNVKPSMKDKPTPPLFSSSSSSTIQRRTLPQTDRGAGAGGARPKSTILEPTVRRCLSPPGLNTSATARYAVPNENGGFSIQCVNKYTNGYGTGSYQQQNLDGVFVTIPKNPPQKQKQQLQQQQQMRSSQPAKSSTIGGGSSAKDKDAPSTSSTTTSHSIDKLGIKQSIEAFNTLSGQKKMKPPRPPPLIPLRGYNRSTNVLSAASLNVDLNIPNITPRDQVCNYRGNLIRPRFECDHSRDTSTTSVVSSAATGTAVKEEQPSTSAAAVAAASIASSSSFLTSNTAAQQQRPRMPTGNYRSTLRALSSIENLASIVRPMTATPRASGSSSNMIKKTVTNSSLLTSNNKSTTLQDQLKQKQQQHKQQQQMYNIDSSISRYNSKSSISGSSANSSNKIANASGGAGARPLLSTTTTNNNSNNNNNGVTSFCANATTTTTTTPIISTTTITATVSSATSSYNDSGAAGVTKNECIRNSSSTTRTVLPPVSPTTTTSASQRYWDRETSSSLTNSGSSYRGTHALSASSSSSTPSSAISKYSSTINDAASTNGRERAECEEGLCGLKNIGNTCFMNSVIQCLSHTVDLTNFLRSNQCAVARSASTKDLNILNEFAKLIKSMWVADVNSVTPMELKYAFSTKHRMYSDFNQQDAQEFLRFFLDSLHSALNCGVKMTPLNIDDNLSDNKKADLTWESYARHENSLIRELFVGQLKSTLKCTTCGNTSVTFDPFWDLSVSLPSTSHCKLETCLEMFIREEVLDGDEMPTCSTCKTRRKCTKSFTIQRFPKYLVIHLKRFSETRWSKLTNIVEFPIGERELNMAPFAANITTSVQYSLYAVSNHMGSTAGGHYVALCKHPVSRKWHEFNDNIVSDVNESLLVSSSAYILFYKRA